MLSVSSEATEALKSIMAEKEIDSPVRIFVQQGCGGAMLALGVDGGRESDDIVDIGGVTFVMDRYMAAELGEITVHYLDDAAQPGFTIDSEKPLPQMGDGGCDGGCC